MAQRTDIRRIGKYLRQHGADGSLVAWVEAELERVDLTSPRPGQLRALREDLTVPERELIVRALLNLAITPDQVESRALDAAQAVGVELGIDVSTVDYLLRAGCGWSLEQARMLASMGLPTSTTPAQLEEAQAVRLTITADRVPPLHAHRLELPPEGESTREMTDEQGNEVTETLARAEPMTERMDHLAEALRRLDEEPDTDDLADDPDTVEMSREALRSLAQRHASPPPAGPVPRPAAQPAPPKPAPAKPAPPKPAPAKPAPAKPAPAKPAPAEPAPAPARPAPAKPSAPAKPAPAKPAPAKPAPAKPAQAKPAPPAPPLSRTEISRDRPPSFSSLARAFQDGPPSVGFGDDDAKSLAAAFDEGLEPTPDLLPLDWGDGAITVNEFTLSERLEQIDLELPDRDEPTLMVDREQVEVALRAPEVATRPPPTPEPSLELELDGDEAWVRAQEGPDLPRGLTDEVPIHTSPPPATLPHSWEAPAPRPGEFDTAELLGLDPDRLGPSTLDTALGKIFPVDDEPELSLDPVDDDIPELALDDDEPPGPVARRWQPPPATGDDSGGLTGELVEERSGLPGSSLDSLGRELQPIDERLLGRAWKPPATPGHATMDLDLDDDEELELDEVEDGLTSELKPVLDDKPRRQRTRGAQREGLTQDLQPLFDAPERKRRRGAPAPEGLTQDLQLVLDDED